MPISVRAAQRTQYDEFSTALTLVHKLHVVHADRRPQEARALTISARRNPTSRKTTYVSPPGIKVRSLVTSLAAHAHRDGQVQYKNTNKNSTYICIRRAALDAMQFGSFCQRHACPFCVMFQ